MEKIDSKREKNKIQKHNSMILSAQNLILENGSTDFSMKRLAAHAGVAEVTPYKYFQTKKGVLEAVLRDCQQQLMERTSHHSVDSHSLDRIINFGSEGAQVFVENEALYRPLLEGLIQLQTDYLSQSPIFHEWVPLWETELRDAVADKNLHSFVDLALVSRALHIHWVGAAVKWISKEATNAEFIQDVRYGVCAFLLGIATENGHPFLRNRFAECERELQETLSQKI